MPVNENLVCVGAIGGAHGVQGEMRLRSFTLIPEDCFAYGTLTDENGTPVLDAKSWRPAKNHFIVVPEQKRTREEWEADKGKQLFVPRDVLPPPDEDEFYYDDLIGMSVLHKDGRELGRVKAVQNFGADDLLEIVAPDERTAYYLPFTHAVIPVIRVEERQLLAEPDEAYLPEGLQLTEED